VYEKIPDFDYYSTYEKLYRSSLFSSVDHTQKGHIQAKYKDTDVLVQFSTNGVPLIWYSDDKDKERIFNDLEKLGLHLKPKEANVWNIPFPLPSSFKLSFCDVKVLYVGLSSILFANVLFVLLGSSWAFLDAFLIPFEIPFGDKFFKFIIMLSTGYILIDYFKIRNLIRPSPIKIEGKTKKITSVILFLLAICSWFLLP
jgi:hypothetical protein